MTCPFVDWPDDWLASSFLLYSAVRPDRGTGRGRAGHGSPPRCTVGRTSHGQLAGIDAPSPDQNGDLMSQRIDIEQQLPDAYQALMAVYETVEAAVARVGLDQKLIELAKLRVSQINGCAFCTDLHSRDARRLGETERRLYLLPAWRETDLYTERDRAALTLAEAMTRLPAAQEVTDEVYSEVTKVFTAEEYAVIAWAITVINAFNRLCVTSRTPLPQT
jgi:AhpD family alkylhydroperoxidase